ncbi:MAG TPA: sigma-54 dependent transcriptional regulator [Pyrinomonadaceae bacterium]|nr:sigma-54 dependent transcriptional regulator [Pyrinomonadaceae bacterium]
MSKLQALVIDDEPQVRNFVAEVLRDDGWAVDEADSAERAFELLRERRYTLVFCDVMFSGTADGFTVLRRLTQEQPEAHIVLMTGYGSAAGALDATAFGALDYLLKPFSFAEVQDVANAVRRQVESRPRAPVESERAAYVHTSDLNLIGRSAAFVKVMKLVGRLAATNLPVLITGESGTGKEVVARAIHRRSARADKPFVAVNCGALPAELIESELFGHVKGSFTGAHADRVGLWEEAHGGTVFLDEITETTPAFQVKLLRALQEGEIRRVGSNRTIYVDVRVIAATNRDPEPEVAEKRFRQDLFYRLNAVSLHLPPLRERREDIMPLTRHFATRARATGAPALQFSRDAINALESYSWPGNIRELENAVVRAAALCDHTVRADDLPERIREQHAAAVADSPAADIIGAGTSEQTVEWPTLAEVEGRYVARVLAHTGGNKQAAARLLNVDRKTLQRMIQRHHLAPHGDA